VQRFGWITKKELDVVSFPRPENWMRGVTGLTVFWNEESGMGFRFVNPV
jgi:hypothetical protein